MKDVSLNPLELDRNEAAYTPFALKTRTHVKPTLTRKFKERRSLAYPTKNGYGDPLSNALLVDLLIRLKPGQIIRASNLTPMLQANYPQVRWDPYTIGRMLGVIAAAAKEANPERPAVSTARDWVGRTFIIDDHPESHAWMVNLLDKLGTAAEAAVQRGEPEIKTADPVALAMAAA